MFLGDDAVEKLLILLAFLSLLAFCTCVVSLGDDAVEKFAA